MTISVAENTIVAIPHSGHVQISSSEQYQQLKGEKRRDWFSDHAYLCLPLTIGNQYGFVVKSAHTFDVIWNGGPNLTDTKIIMHDFDGDHKNQHINSHFGLGIVTVQNAFTLRTPQGVNLMTINPPNYFIDGIGHMTGVVECDNLRRDFTFNFKITRPNHTIRVNRGDWIGAFIPIPRYFVDSFQMIDAKDILTPEQIAGEQKASKDFGKERNGPDKEKAHQAGRRYFQGEDVYGNKFVDHQKRIR